MGYGLPACIGAKVASPDKVVVDIDGDASFSMTAMELATAAQYNIGVKVLILNNEFQGMVEQWQGEIKFFNNATLLSQETDSLPIHHPQISSTRSDILTPRWSTPTLSLLPKPCTAMPFDVTTFEIFQPR